MTDRKQFEAMLEALISDNQEEAKEIFHNIVVSKSREIYEELLAEDFGGPEEEEEEEDTDSEEEGDDEEESGDATDDFISDVEDDETDSDSSEGEGDLEDRVLDLEDSLEELRAEFEELMAGEENEPEHSDMFGGDEEDSDFGDEEGPEFGDEEGTEDEFGGELSADDQQVKEIHHYFHDGEEEEEEMDEFSQFMEYVNKVALPNHGDNGANSKSIVAGKNNMGGTTANITKGGVAKGEGTKGGLLNPSTQEENFGNVNVPGGNAGKSAFKKKEPGHGAEKKGSGDTAPNKRSIIGGSK